METKVLLIRHGVTEWHVQGRVLGQRDVPLSAAGTAQMSETAAALDGCRIAEILASPLQRALQSAEILGRRWSIEVARDPRLTDVQLGKWSGMARTEIAASPEYQRFMSGPASERCAGGESLLDVQRRAVAAVEQAITDNPSGDAIAIVTHASVIRLVLTHYFGAPATAFHRLSVAPGSVSVLAFAGAGAGEREVPRLHGMNLTSGVARAVHGAAPTAAAS